ncbi:putative C6 transcription factor [Aspergillus heteromorphus CBS 117.55]|uniref:Putative C6 transcription factor n=1 Tax=Aspergillus heteromorphus CBS 117.55 TaxID=1448321 RepID=A0A317WF60_9EURO|nr:putative C6 transcription factor [Aspergillus heteromorphus CBS 117.55]PWY85043.1 putative C6 transcription factor [Aspergillus heteromorphus CBS 117.55]
MSSQVATPGQERQRSRQACVPCRQRKRKCDGKLPCSTCTGYGYTCDFKDVAEQNSAKRSAESEGYSPRVAKAVRVSAEPHDSPAVPSAQQHGVLEPSKQRYVGRQSSVAFPLFVGLDVQATNPPRLHSFAYNAGIRREPGYSVNFQVAEYISWDTVKSLIDVYMSAIHPVFKFLDEGQLYQRGEEHWNGQRQGSNFEAVISGVIALGSLFKGALGQEREMRVVRHAKDILEDYDVGRSPCIEQVSAWILRTIYVRATSRPHISWLCSCTMMHLVEATGLHHEPDAMILPPSKTGPDSTGARPDTVKRIAQVAECLHVLIAYDYGRSVMNISIHSQEPVRFLMSDADFTPQLCQLIQSMPVGQMFRDSAVGSQQLVLALEKVTSVHVDHDFLMLVRTDLAFCLYRRLRLGDSRLQQEQQDLVISTGMAALGAANRLADQNWPWWNVLGTVFQFVCVLLAMDTPASLVKLPESVKALETISGYLNTHLATEALATARQLIRASMDKKRKGLTCLERALGDNNTESLTNTAAYAPAPIDGAFDPFSQSLQSPFLDLDFLLDMDFMH